MNSAKVNYSIPGGLDDDDYGDEADDGSSISSFSGIDDVGEDADDADDGDDVIELELYYQREEEDDDYESHRPGKTAADRRQADW